MLRLTGCMLIFLSCCALGAIKASTYKARSHELENIMELVKLLELEISYQKEPLGRSFQKTARRKHCWFSNVLQSSSESLAAQCTLHDAWENALNRHASECPLDVQDTDILRDMALGLGRSDAQGQSRILEPVMMRLKIQLDGSREQERKHGRMYRSLGIAAGAVIVIMMI